MPNQQANGNRKGSESTAGTQQARTHTFTLYLFIFFSCLVFFVIASIAYAKSLDKVKDGYFSLLCLFAIPPLFQLAGIIVLHQKYLQYPQSLEKFYRFYLSWMSFSLASYTALWCLYGYYDNDPKPNLLIQYVPIVCAILLVRPIWGMTYAITESMEAPMNGEAIEHGPASESSAIQKALAGCKDWFLMKDMKESISNAPYWALLFFFTIYLVLVYTFGFAFAFHDMAELKSKRLPGLFMPEAFSSEDATDAKSDNSKLASAENSIKNLSDTFRFYFRPQSSELILKTSNSDDTPQGRTSVSETDVEKRNRVWRETENLSQMKALEQKINESTKNNKSISIRILGQADGQRISDGKETNFSLSQNRASRVWAEITTRFWGDKTKRDIDWQHVPVGSTTVDEFPSASTNDAQIAKDYDELEREYTVKDEKNQLNGVGTAKGADVVSKIRNATTSDGKKAFEHQIKNHLGELGTIVNKLRENLKKPKGDSETSKDSNGNSKIPEDDQGLIERIKKILDRAQFASGDAGERVVLVTLTQLENIPPYQKFKLLDYVVYTIIGPDYGDFIPRTSYAKFLCAFANIVKLFFTIALFSAVLSLKRPSKPSESVLPPAPPMSSEPVALTTPAETGSLVLAVPTDATESIETEKSLPDSREPAFAYYPGSEREVRVEIQRPSGASWKAIPESGLVYKVNFPATQSANQNRELKVVIHAQDDLEWNAFVTPETATSWIICKADKGRNEVTIDADKNTDEGSRSGRVVIGNVVFFVEQKGITPSTLATNSSGTETPPEPTQVAKRSRAKKGVAPTS